jgi:serine/threonine protein kinase/ActR/RegA family two-component response regulator
MAEQEHPFTILVVDDNEMNRDMLSRRLQRKGYTTVTAEDGQRALDLLALEPIDLVLLDIMMPGLSGIDVLREVRKSRSGHDLPIIMATAKDGSDDVVEALDLGANDYITKPLDFPIVLARVHAQLRSKVPARRKFGGPVESVKLDAGETRPGMVLAEKYRLDRTIGAGSFGAVFEAVHLTLQRPVAVKVLQSNFDLGKEALSRFQQEGISACRVRHPNAVEVLDFGVTPGGVAFLVMELLEGSPLSDAMYQDGPLEPLRCAEILMPVCEALAEAHSVGIIHRDIKPANIFLHRNRRGEVVKVLDFGIAKLLNDSAVDQNSTLDGGLLGTPAYMAPERVQGLDYDGRTDVYSLGVMLYQMLSGQLPFGDDSGLSPVAMAMKQVQEQPLPIRALRPDLPITVEAVLMQALEKDPGHRPTAEIFGRELAMALGLPVESSRLASVQRNSGGAAPPPQQQQPPRPSPPRHPMAEESFAYEAPTVVQPSPTWLPGALGARERDDGER